MKNLEPAGIAEIHNLLRTTPMTFAQIAERLDLGMRTISRHAADVPREERFRPFSKTSPRDVVEAIHHRLMNTDDPFCLIAKDLGVVDSTVRRYAAKLKPGTFPLRPSNREKQINQATRARIVKLAIEGMTAREIAPLVGYTRWSVHVVMRDNRDMIEAAKAKHAPAHVEPEMTFEERLRADGWDDAFIAAASRLRPRLSVAMRVAA